jgi:serine/threonine protein kinase
MAQPPTQSPDLTPFPPEEGAQGGKDPSTLDPLIPPAPLEEAPAFDLIPASAESSIKPGRIQAPSLEGQTIDDFAIVEEVGRGGMGVVYKARQISLDRVVALKMLMADYFQKPVRLQRFMAEARAAASLAHPNIVSIYQIGDCYAGHYYAMEYIEGRSLESIIRERMVPYAWAVSLMIPVTHALHYAHTRGIVHRDLKPSNIMIDKMRRPVVLDFGLAKFVNLPSTMTHQGVVMGTPAYMAPEQAGEDAAQVGPQCDVYSLGAVLYHMLAGRPPFLEQSAVKTVMKVISPEPPLPLSTFRSDVPPKLEHICMKCLRKNADDRYQSADALLRRFRRLLPTLPRKGTPPPPPARPAALLVAQETGDELRLNPSTTIIGRSSECDIVLRAADVSKRHCRIVMEADQIMVEDLSSVNGTAVNGKAVDRAPLMDGDTLEIAGHSFRFKLRKPK